MPASLRRQIGRLLIAGFNGSQVPVELRSIAREFGLGGVILFSRNIEAPEQVAELCYDAGRLVPDLPLWVSIDQEGGRVARLKAPFTEWPPMATLGRSGDLRLAERFARALAAELKAVGVTLDYAPVLDVMTNAKNPVIGDRALATTADDVARLGATIIRTLQAEGMAACGKHFPGHGDTSVDSHLELPLVEHPPDRLRAIEFVPFRAAVQADVATIMTAHVLVPSLDEDRPATLSRRVVTDLLRKELGYGGVILSDDLEMKAIAHDVRRPGRRGDGDRRRLRRRPDLQRRPRRRRRRRSRRWCTPSKASGCRTPASRTRCSVNSARRSGFSGAAMTSRPAQVAVASATDRPGRAPGDRRRDGAVPLMLKPRALKPGSRLAVVAPASSFKREEFDAGVAEIVRLGFEPVYDESVFAKGSPAYVAGSAEVRAKAIRSALSDPSIDGIIGVRGGYGSAQLLPLLDVDEVRHAPQAVHRLQRSDGDPQLPDDSVRRRRVSRADARRMPEPWGGALRPRVVSERGLPSVAGRRACAARP